MSALLFSPVFANEKYHKSKYHYTIFDPNDPRKIKDCARARLQPARGQVDARPRRVHLDHIEALVVLQKPRKVLGREARALRDVLRLVKGDCGWGGKKWG